MREEQINRKGDRRRGRGVHGRCRGRPTRPADPRPAARAAARRGSTAPAESRALGTPIKTYTRASVRHQVCCRAVVSEKGEGRTDEEHEPHEHVPTVPPAEERGDVDEQHCAFTRELSVERRLFPRGTQEKKRTAGYDEHGHEDGLVETQRAADHVLHEGKRRSDRRRAEKKKRSGEQVVGVRTS